MKKSLFCLILFIVCVLLFGGCSQKDTYDRAIKIHDVNCYINEDYLSKEKFDNWFLTSGGEFASQFFPKYSEIDFNYKAVDFYIYCHDSDDTFFVYPDSTFVLEFTFENKMDYQVLLERINTEYKFLKEPVKNGLFEYQMPVTGFELGDYFCRITTNEDKYKNWYPYSVEIVCTNETDLIIRYLYCYDSDHDVVTKKEFLKAIKNATICDW